MPSEHEVREVVRVVLEGLLDEPAPATAGPLPTSPEIIGDGVLLPDRTATIAIGADHGGFVLKERIGFLLREKGYEVTDVGTHSRESVDYPDFAHQVARLVGAGTCGAGIIIDGAGIGSCIVANKVPGVRAALCYDVSSARNSREHNHANVVTLGAGLIGENLAWQIVEAWLTTPWGEGRHARRVAKITEIERAYSRGEE